MSKYILNTLKKAKIANQIISIHSDPSEQSKCSVGFVDQIKSGWVRLRAISPEGEEAGYEIRPLEEIFRIDINSDYENKIDFLRNNYKDIFEEVELSLPIEKGNIIFTTLKEAQQKHLVVILWTEDEFDSVIGYVENLEQDSVRILSIDDFGREDGFIILDLTKVTSVDCNSRKCQIIKFLNRNWGRSNNKGDG